MLELLNAPYINGKAYIGPILGTLIGSYIEAVKKVKILIV